MTTTNTGTKNYYIIDMNKSKVGDTFWNVANCGDGSYMPKQWIIVQICDRCVLAEPTHLRNSRHRFMDGLKMYADYDSCQQACIESMEK